MRPAWWRQRSRQWRCLPPRMRCAMCCRILKRENSLTATFDHLLPLDDYYELVGLKDMLTREEAYDRAAAALIQKRAAE